jgi:hypothetical protein
MSDKTAGTEGLVAAIWELLKDIRFHARGPWSREIRDLLPALLDRLAAQETALKEIREHLGNPIDFDGDLCVAIEAMRAQMESWRERTRLENIRCGSMIVEAHHIHQQLRDQLSAQAALLVAARTQVREAAVLLEQVSPSSCITVRESDMLDLAARKLRAIDAALSEI